MALGPLEHNIDLHLPHTNIESTSTLAQHDIISSIFSKYHAQLSLHLHASSHPMMTSTRAPSTHFALPITQHQAFSKHHTCSTSAKCLPLWPRSLHGMSSFASFNLSNIFQKTKNKTPHHYPPSTSSNINSCTSTAAHDTVGAWIHSHGTACWSLTPTLPSSLFGALCQHTTSVGG